MVDGILESDELRVHVIDKTKYKHLRRKYSVQWSDDRYARVKKLTATQHRLLAYLETKIRFGNVINANESEIMSELRIKRNKLLEHLRELHKAKLIQRRYDGYYYINPYVVYLGKKQNYEAILAEWDSNKEDGTDWVKRSARRMRAERENHPYMKRHLSY